MYNFIKIFIFSLFLSQHGFSLYYYCVYDDDLVEQMDPKQTPLLGQKFNIEGARLVAGGRLNLGKLEPYIIKESDLERSDSKSWLGLGAKYAYFIYRETAQKTSDRVEEFKKRCEKIKPGWKEVRVSESILSNLTTKALPGYPLLFLLNGEGVPENLVGIYPVSTKFKEILEAKQLEK